MSIAERKLADAAKVIPNPGSDDARNLGCACPVGDNHHGTGVPYQGVAMFWVSADCELHGQKRTTNETDSIGL